MASRLRRPLSLRNAVLLLVLLPSVAVGCGGGGNSAPRSLPGPAEQLLTENDVQTYPEGTAAHALLRWWRSAQYANLATFLNSFERSLRAELEASPQTEDALVYFAGALRTARPRIVGAQRDGARATVYTRIVYRQPVGTTRFIVNEVPRAFEFVLQNGSWRLSDDLLFQTTLPMELRR